MNEREGGQSSKEMGEIREGKREVDPESVEYLQALVEQLRQERDEYRRQARTDELTGLPNRRVFNESLEQVLRKANIFLVIVDIDELKKINDEHDHDTGDEAIKRIGKILVGVTRKDSDIVARIGGDEFVIIGACSSGTQVGQIVPSLRQRINPKLTESSGDLEGIELEVSMGAAIVRKGETITAKELKQRADQDMYRDKRSRGGD